MKIKEALKLYGSTLGGHLHVIEVVPVDREDSKKDEAVRIKIPVNSFTIKHIKVNTVAHKQMSGNIDVVVINGGQAELSVGLAEKLVMKAEELPTGYDLEKKRTFFGNAATPTEITKALNLSEVARIDAIIADLTAQKDAILDIVAANDRSVEAFDGE
jgi:hypothetical protein